MYSCCQSSNRPSDHQVSMISQNTLIDANSNDMAKLALVMLFSIWKHLVKPASNNALHICGGYCSQLSITCWCISYKHCNRIKASFKYARILIIVLISRSCC
uniref:Uncharacterized protein n=1 Tax=Glossina morsitans morsitans TaxID=37546 RepID=A0A1B0G348_GLOMM